MTAPPPRPPSAGTTHLEFSALAATTSQESFETQQGKPQLYVRMAILGVCAAGLACITALLVAPTLILPAEDVVILYQYSRNLAQTGIISYFSYGPKVEGATDFLWMLLLSVGMKLGLSPYLCGSIVSIGSIFGIAGILLSMAKVQRTILNLLFVVGALSVFPPIIAAIGGFSVLPFGLLLTATVWAVENKRTAAAGVFSLLLCLLRPDGIVFAVPLLIFAILVSRSPWRDILVYLSSFILPGMLYFAWRWHYFGEFFPLPFLVKSDTPRLGRLFVVSSFAEGIGFIFFAVVMFWRIAYGRARDARAWRLFLCLLLIPTLFYCSMRLDQDVACRFFFYLPLSVAIIASLNWSQLRPIRGQVVIFAGFMWLVCLARPYRTAWENAVDQQFWNRRDIAIALSGLTHKHTMMATEAGILPYYSGWIAEDPWGLNTPLFAHRLIQPEDVKDHHPDLIQVYDPIPEDSACRADAAWPTPYKVRSFEGMERNILVGIESNSYTELRIPHYPDQYRIRHQLAKGKVDFECWFVLKGNRDHDQIVNILRAHGGISEEEFLSLSSR